MAHQSNPTPPAVTGAMVDETSTSLSSGTITSRELFTRMVVNATGPGADPRYKATLSIAIRHLHACFGELKFTPSQFLAFLDLVIKAGQDCAGVSPDIQTWTAILSGAVNRAAEEPSSSGTGLGSSSQSSPRLEAPDALLQRHLHAFLSEANLTPDQVEAAIRFLIRICKWSTPTRNELLLVFDILGVESLVDDAAWQALSAAATAAAAAADHALTPTPSAILGPFYIPNMPLRPLGASILDPILLTDQVSSPASWLDEAKSTTVLMTGRVLSSGLSPSSCSPSSSPIAPGDPIPSATVDVWQCAPNGLYSQQDPSTQNIANLRGRFETDASGAFSLVCILPTPYPIPRDGPAGDLLGLLDRDGDRPAHIHFIVSSPKHRTLTTQVFNRAECEGGGGKDAVFAVKEELVADVKKEKVLANGQEVHYQLKFDFVLVPEMGL